MKAESCKIGDGVYWVGTLDWDIRTYHGYTLQGTTYNAYLVFGRNKVALIDNTYPGTSSQMWGRIAHAFSLENRDPSIDVIVQNHIERDHSGALVEIHKKFPKAPVHCTETARKGLLKHYPQLDGAEFVVSKTGTSIDLGGKTLTNVETPLLHWPDSMETFLPEQGILFSNDAFSQHLCYARRYDRDIPEAVLMDAAAKFYGNLLVLPSKMLVKKMGELATMGIVDKILMIAPGHGQIWTNPAPILSAYTEWSTGICRDKVTIIYDTMHHSTQMMAHAIAEGLIAGGMDVKMYYLHEDERSEIVKDVLTSRGICVGIPTINDAPFPSIGDIIYYLKGLRFDRTGTKRGAVTFGSMGGRGGAVKKIAEELTEAGFEVQEQMECYFVPDENELLQCFELGKKFAVTLAGT
ncbi:MAG TPA: FprA family A-type flavoprotein [Methanoregula sp.]|nr:FprA family A-type flavoprotein [Methanoregula sp.]